MRLSAILAILCLGPTVGHAVDLPRCAEAPEIVLPDYGAELRAFDYPRTHPISWHSFMVNAGYGTGRGGPSRQPGKWFDTYWILCDYLDRSGDYVSHQYLSHRGIPFEVYGYNEYQETIHFHEQQALELFENNGIARDYNNELVMSEHYNLSVESWAKSQDFNAYIVCNNAPRWSSVINYDLLGSPLIGFATSQDNIGGPVSRIGAGCRGRYCDFCSLRFFDYLQREGKLPEFRARYSNIRDYVRERITQGGPYRMLEGDLRWNEVVDEQVRALCDDPVLAEYQKFQYMSHAHNLMRYYLDCKAMAERLGIEFDVHGNQAGGMLGINSYPLLISQFVDQAWFETAGMSQYDMFRYHWHNAHGAMRFVLGLASAPGKPLLCMTTLGKEEPELLEHEYAESCAGGGVLFAQQAEWPEDSPKLEVLRQYWAFRHDHRAIFSAQDRRRHAQVAVVYSIPTQMYAQYRTSVQAPHFNDLSGIGRSLLDAHIPFDALIFHDPNMRADDWTVEDLQRYRVIVLPSVHCVSDAQVEALAQFLRTGGRIAVIGEFGLRDENNQPREPTALEYLRQQGEVTVLLDGQHMFFNRATESDATRAVADRAAHEVRTLEGQTLITGGLPRLLWVTPWVHGTGAEAILSVHLVNYDVDFEAGRANPTAPVQLSVRLPEALRAEEAIWLTPGGGPQALPLQIDGDVARVQVPSVRIYGVVVIGPTGAERRRSDQLQGDAMIARARFALGGDLGEFAGQAEALAALRAGDPSAYRAGAEALLRDVAARLDAALIAEYEAMADTEGAVLAIDFGASEDSGPWRALSADMAYTPERGYGWLPLADGSRPTPEETGYAFAHRYPAGRDRIETGSLPFWPYGKQPPPQIIRRALFGCQQRTLRVDLPDGTYQVSVVTANPSWTMRSYRCSGMISANGAVREFDVPYYPGGAVRRSFAATVQGGHLDLTFGGPTGWGVCAVIIREAEADPGDALADEAVRDWLISPRYPNPQWWPIQQVRFRPDEHLAAPDTTGWTPVSADAGGVVHLGDNTQAETGDVVYAVATLQADEDRPVWLNVGATSSAEVYVNGQRAAYLPNVKGLQRDECTFQVPLRAGPNTIVVKLERYWERQWMFYVSRGMG